MGFSPYIRVKHPKREGGPLPWRTARLSNYTLTARSRRFRKPTPSTGGYCYNIAYNILTNPEDAEESVSDTYLSAWNSIPPRHPPALAAFLGKITRNISIDRWRKYRAFKRGEGQIELALEELSECVSGAESAEDAAIRREVLASLNRFLATLKDTERSVFLCRYWYLDSTEENRGEVRLYRQQGKIHALPHPEAAVRPAARGGLGMTNLELLDILGGVGGKYILQAQQLRSRETPEHRWSWKRTIVLFAAVLALMTMLCGTAMAVSEDFRNYVFDLIGIFLPPKTETIMIEGLEEEIKYSSFGEIPDSNGRRFCYLL